MHKNKTRIIYKIKTLLVVLVIFCSFAVLNTSFAQSFIGPSCAAGLCQGKIGVDSSGNVSMGTSTPQSGTKTLIISQTSDSSSYGLRVLSSNNSPLFLVRSDGKISIATSGASYALTVSGDIYASGNLVVGGTFSAPIPAGNVTPGVFNSLQGGGTGAYAFLGSLGIATSSQVGLPQALSVYGGGYFSGNVGIGTTGPGAKLHVVGTVYGAAGLNPSDGVAVTNSAWSSFKIYEYASDNWAGIGAYTNGLPWIRNGIDVVNSSGNSIFRVTNAGNVGIGTTGPGARLEVESNVDGSGTGIWIDNIDQHLRLQSFYQTGVGQYATIQSFNDAGTVAQALALNPSGGNVGIGTTTPAYKLDVVGQINSSGGLCIAGDCKTSWSQVGGSSQWTTTSTGIYYSGGNVGIGNVPSASLPLNIETSSTAYTGIGLVNTDVSSRTWSIFSNSNSTTFGPSKGFGIRDITAGATRLVIDTNGNVGIGTTAPAYTLDVNGNIRIRDNYNLIVNSTYGKIEITTGVGYPGVKISTGYPTGGTIEFGYPQSGGVYDAKIYRSGSSQLRASSSLIIDGSLGIGTTTPYYKLDVVSAGSVTARFGTASTDQVIIGGGAGKLNVGTVDPPYTINGKKYATYVSAMTGQKEETTGIIKVKNSECQIKNNSKICESKINFNLEPEGSDLWLFSKVTNLKNNFNKMAVILSGDFKGRLWYNKNNNLVLSIYFEPEEEKENYEISYRLTAPRFDADKFLNERNNSDPNEPEGLIINE